jgi:predicted ATP-binding protein involved in virulence
LLNTIQSKIRNIVYDDTVNALYECLESNSRDSYFEYDLSSEKVQNLLQIIFELKLHVPIMEMFWPRRLSSGESCYLRMFSRLYDSILNEKKFDSINNLEALFIIDEVDLYLHPEWQRCWLWKFIHGMKLMEKVSKVNLNLHLVLATHSPFMLTDFSSESIVRLAREEDLLTKAQNSESNTLAANIFDFLEGDFFLDSSIGEHVRKKIKELVDEIDQTNKTKEPLSDYSKMIINNIGDPIIKTLLVNRKGLQYDID